MTESARKQLTEEERIRLIIKAFGCDKAEALFIIALQDGIVDGDIIELSAEDLRQKRREPPDK